MDPQQRGCDRSPASPDCKEQRAVTPPPELKEKAALSILSLPSEVVEKVLFKLSVNDVLSFGSTCHRFHELSLSQSVWKSLYYRNFTGPVEINVNINWRRVTILKMTQSLVLQHLNTGLGRHHHSSIEQPASLQTFNNCKPLGFRRVVPIRGHTLLCDYNGTIFSIQGETWTLQDFFNCTVLCHQAKDVAVDPHTNRNLRQYIYVLKSLESSDYPSESVEENPGPIPPLICDVVEVYHWENYQKILTMTLHPSFCYTQIRLSGSKENRSLLMLTDDGIVFSTDLNETQFNNEPDYSREIAAKKICYKQPKLAVRQLHTSPNSIVYITDDGSVFAEVHSPGAYRQLCGTYAGFNPSENEILLSLEIPLKVVKCSIGLNHMSLLDECGRIFMQGCNPHGQLGTGDRNDRSKPTLVEVSMAPVDIWCGLNHTLLLLEDESGEKQVHGCGCGSRGRLPGYMEGSSVFVRLNVEVPHFASSLCSTAEWLCFSCGHDVDKTPARCYIPPETKDQREGEKDQEEGIEDLFMYHTQMNRCVETKRQVMMLQEAVDKQMAELTPAHKDFLDAALTIILNGSDKNK